jgi:hypothetical protein
MYAFDRWQVKEDPAFGLAVITLWLTALGVADGEPFPAEPSLFSQASGFGDNIIADDARRIIFHIKAKPWHESGLRPFACDAFAQQLPGKAWFPLFLFVIAADAVFDHTDFDQKRGQAFSKLSASMEAGDAARKVPVLKVLRVMSSAQIPDLGEPINLPDMLRAETWSIEEACLDDWRTLVDPPEKQQQSASFQLVTPSGLSPIEPMKPWEYLPIENELRASLQAVYWHWIRVSQHENQLLFESGPAHAVRSRDTSQEELSWRLQIRWTADKPAYIYWSFDSPFRFRNVYDRPQCRLRLIASPEVISDLSFEVLANDGKDEDGFELDPTNMNRWIFFDPVRIEVTDKNDWDNPTKAFIEGSAHFTPIYPLRPPRATELMFRRDPSLLAGLVLLPLMLIPSPAQPVAIAIGIPLAFGSLYCAQAERAHVVKYGYDSTWQPRTLNEVDRDLLLAIAGLVLSAGGALRTGSQIAIRCGKRSAKPVDLSKRC